MTGHWIMSPPRVFGGSFTVDHSLICKIEGFVTKRHNKLRHLEAELLTVRYSVILRLSQSSKTSLENSYEEDLINRKMRDWISMHLGFRERSAFFDDRVCYPNAEQYKDLGPQQIYRMHEKKRHLYSRRVLDIEHGSFTPFSGLYKTGGKGVSEELIAIKIGEHREKPMSCHSHY